MNNLYSAPWDRKLNYLMSKHKFVFDGRSTARLGDIILWVDNHPCASFSPYGPVNLRVRPSRLTIEKAHEKLMEDMFPLNEE